MNWKVLLALGAAVALSQILLWWLVPPPQPQQVTGPPRSGYSLDNFSLDVLTRDGSVGFTLQAPHLQRRDADDSLFIDEPDFSLPSSEGPPWYGRAEYGWVSADGSLLKLSGKVLLQRPATASQGASTIDGADLSVWPQDKRIASAAATEIHEPGRILSGTGIRADLATHTLELLANVHGTLEPSRNP